MSMLKSAAMRFQKSICCTFSVDLPVKMVLIINALPFH